MSHRIETHSSVKRNIPPNTKRELHGWQFPDYPVREKRKHHPKHEPVEKMENQNHIIRDFPHFVSMSQWAAVSQSLGKSASHTAELSTQTGLLNIYTGKSREVDSGKADIYLQNYCLEAMALSEQEEVQSDQIYTKNFGEKEPGMRKNSETMYALKSKKRNSKSNRLEGFSRKFKTVDSANELKKMLEDFEIVNAEDIDKNGTEMRNIVPAYFVLKLAGKSADDSVVLDEAPSSTGQNFKVIFANDDTNTKFVETINDTYHAKTIANTRNKGIQTGGSEDSIETQSQSTNVGWWDKVRSNDVKICPACLKIEEDFKFQREFNVTLLEQLKNMLGQLTVLMSLLNELLNCKNVRHNKEEKCLKDSFLKNLILKENEEVGVQEIKTPVILTSLDSVITESLRLENREAESVQSDETDEEFKNSYRAYKQSKLPKKLTKKKYDDIIYLSPADLDEIKETHLRKELESSELDEKNKHSRHSEDSDDKKRKDILIKDKSDNTITLESDKNEIVVATELEEPVKELKLKEKETSKDLVIQDVVEYVDTFDLECTKVESGTAESVKTLEKEPIIPVEDKLKKMTEVPDILISGKEPEYESGGNEAFSCSNDDNSIKFAPFPPSSMVIADLEPEKIVITKDKNPNGFRKKFYKFFKRKKKITTEV